MGLRSGALPRKSIAPASLTNGTIGNAAICYNGRNRYKRELRHVILPIRIEAILEQIEPLKIVSGVRGYYCKTLGLRGEINKGAKAELVAVVLPNLEMRGPIA